MRFRRSFLLATVISAFAVSAYANTSVHGQINAFIVKQDIQGKEKILPAVETEPGQTMEFQIVFTNDGDTSVDGIQVVDPVPENTQFIGTSERADVPAVFEVSIDGGVSFEPEPVVRIETQPDGTQKKVVIPASEYTHLRWTAQKELEKDGGKQLYSYRVSVK